MTKLPPLPLSVKLAYGVGELAAAIPASLSAFFVLYFFTTVANLSPALAGGVILIGRVWDAINDPVIGGLSDRTNSRLGRRYPWMLGGMVPMALCAFLLWTVPPLASEWGRFTYYAVLSFFAFLAFTAVQLPYTALAAELSEDYDERTSLISAKAGFSIGGGILALVMAQVVFGAIANPRQQYLILGACSASFAVIMVSLCVAGTYRRYWQVESRRVKQPLPPHSLWRDLRSVFRNYAFRQVLGLYLCAWMAVQVTAAMLPYFVGSWMGLPEAHFAQMALAVQGTAIAMLFLWQRLACYSDKRTVFLLGAPLALIALLGLVLVQPGQVGWMYGLGVLAGIGIATLYMMPFAMLPDVVDLDQLQTGLRREGLYFSALVFLQKLGLALALFTSGQVLNWAGFEAQVSEQPSTALWAIRLLIGPLPALLLLVSLWFAYRYPISRDRHRQILATLAQRSQESLPSPLGPDFQGFEPDRTESTGGDRQG